MDNIIKNVTDIVTQSNAHSDNKYVCVLDENGNRITSLLLNAFNSNADEVMKKAQEQYPGKTYILVDESDWRKFIDGNKIYVDGQFVDKPPYVPTPAEVQTKAKRELDTEYQTQRKAMQDAMLTALMAGNDTALQSIREDVAALEAWYTEELANIGTEA